MIVHGKTVDDQTRCEHYHSHNDVIAIKFKCCGEYYPCHLCHEETAGHAALQWPAAEQDVPAILCGICTHELTIDEYFLDAGCPGCGAEFNEGCKLHSHFYFEGHPKNL